jgi:hypothetical protein
MRYLEIIPQLYLAERRQQRTAIMYHGTSSNLVLSILKHGLLARAPRKTYDVDTYGAETASMGGVYVTPSRAFAEVIAEEAVNTHGGEPALVTVQYVLHSGDTDEDEITQSIGDAVNQVIKQTAQHAPDNVEQQYDLSYPREGWAVDQMIRNSRTVSADIAAKSVELLSQYARVGRTVMPVIKQITVDLLKHAADIKDHRSRWNLLRFGTQAHIRQFAETQLDGLMQQVSVDVGDNERARRINRDIKFRGKTRILQIQVGNRVMYRDPHFDQQGEQS